ncbi:MAG: DUF1853 family protein, partial [Verrucomicrobiales bacterium]
RMPSLSHVLHRSLIHAPPLIGDLPEARVFPHQTLTPPRTNPRLNSKQKLGHLMEDPLASLIESTPRFELRARNLQLQTDRHHTVGEMDFLIHDQELDELIHLEFATKFYLAIHSEEGLHFPGPDPSDNYPRKLARLRDHQLRLAETHHSLLPPEFSHETITVRQLVLGILFDSIDSQSPASPEFAHPSCRRGRWISLRECSRLHSSSDHFEWIPKPFWPVPLEFLQDHPLPRWEPPPALNRAVMIRLPHQTTPFLVLPDHGPLSARPHTRNA